MSEQAKNKVADFGKKGGVRAFASGVKSFVKDVAKAAQKNKGWLIATGVSVFIPVPEVTNFCALCTALAITYDVAKEKEAKATKTLGGEVKSETSPNAESKESKCGKSNCGCKKEQKSQPKIDILAAMQNRRNCSL